MEKINNKNYNFKDMYVSMCAAYCKQTDSESEMSHEATCKPTN